MRCVWSLTTLARRISNDPFAAAPCRLLTPRPKYHMPLQRQISFSKHLKAELKEQSEKADERDRLAKIRAEDAARNKIIHLKVRPSEVKAAKTALSKHVASFERAASIKKSKESFFGVIDGFISRDRSRRGHMEFLKTAMVYMEEFGVEKNVEAYNRLLDIFPRGRYDNRTLFDAIWAKKHPQAELALEILTQMEDYWLLPNEDTYDILFEIFGHASQPLQKCRRLIYWYHKLEEMFPNPYPKKLPESDTEISKLALTRMTKDEQIIVVYKDNTSNESQEYLVGAQTKAQKKLLERYNSPKPLYVEGPFFIWVRRLQRYFFTLRTDAECDKENEEGNIVAICMSHANASEDVLRMWITQLQRDNPTLANISIIFNLSQTPQ